MKRKKPSKKTELHKRVEEKLEELSTRISRIENNLSEIEEKTRTSFQDYLRYIELIAKNIYFDILIEDELNRLSKLPSGDTSLFHKVISNIQKKDEIRSQIIALRMGVVTLPFNFQIRVLLDLSKKWNLPFEEIGSCLIEKLGKEEAKRLVGNDDIIQYYGEDMVSIWESLLEG